MSTVNARDRLIVALDVASADEAGRLLDRAGGAVRVVKVGLELYTGGGPEVVRIARARHLGVFLDLKLLDIEETVRRATTRAAELGVQFLTIHAQRKALTAAVEARERSRSSLKLLAVTVLTNLGAQDLREDGIQSTVEELVAARARLAEAVGVDGVVASGEEARLIRKQVRPDFLIVTPGIRPGVEARDEHARVATPASAIAAGADYLVIGRPIRDAPDPKAATEAIVAEMQAAFDAKGK